MIKCYVVIYHYYDDFQIRGAFTSHVDSVKFVISEGKLERPDDHIYETTMQVEKQYIFGLTIVLPTDLEYLN